MQVVKRAAAGRCGQQVQKHTSTTSPSRLVTSTNCACCGEQYTPQKSWRCMVTGVRGSARPLQCSTAAYDGPGSRGSRGKSRKCCHTWSQTYRAAPCHPAWGSSGSAPAPQQTSSSAARTCAVQHARSAYSGQNSSADALGKGTEVNGHVSAATGAGASATRRPAVRVCVSDGARSVADTHTHTHTHPAAHTQPTCRIPAPQ